MFYLMTLVLTIVIYRHSMHYFNMPLFMHIDIDNLLSAVTFENVNSYHSNQQLLRPLQITVNFYTYRLLNTPW